MVVILGWGRGHWSKKIGQIELVFKPTNFFWKRNFSGVLWKYLKEFVYYLSGKNHCVKILDTVGSSSSGSRSSSSSLLL